MATQQNREQTNYLNYPASIGNEAKQGQHYVLFNSYKSESAISADRGLMISSIALYIPPGSLTSTMSQTYSDVAGGATMAVSGRGTNFTNETDLWERSKSIGLGITDTAAGLLTRNETVQNFMSAGFGIAKNNKVALVYKGPGAFRSHTFNFTFFPKDKTEAGIVHAIIEDFQNGAAPTKIAFAGDPNRVTHPFFGSPRQWDIKFMKGKDGSSTRGTNTEGAAEGAGGSENLYLQKLKTSVIESLTINHDPNSVVSFHTDGSPVSSSLTVQFKEIEYVTSKNPADARQDVPPPQPPRDHHPGTGRN